MSWTLVTLMVMAGLSTAPQMISAQILQCPSPRGTKPAGIQGAYNSTDVQPLLPSQFRSDDDIRYFQVWPENIARPRFRFVCEDGRGEFYLRNFTATCDLTVGRLDPRPYYDVGAADDLQPYYKHWKYSEDISVTNIQIFCERNDMRRLYSFRY